MFRFVLEWTRTLPAKQSSTLHTLKPLFCSVSDLTIGKHPSGTWNINLAFGLASCVWHTLPYNSLSGPNATPESELSHCRSTGCCTTSSRCRKGIVLHHKGQAALQGVPLHGGASFKVEKTRFAAWRKGRKNEAKLPPPPLCRPLKHSMKRP